MRLDGYRSVWQFVSRHIKHPWLRRAFSVSPLLVGGNPFDTTSIYPLIHYLERRWGIQFAMGGTGAVVAALGRLMQEVGIELRLNTTVQEILVQNDIAVGVELDLTSACPQILLSPMPTHCFCTPACCARRLCCPG